MPKGTKICKVCGKEYEYCKTVLNGNVFRYQDVACSPECGIEYFRRVAIARGEIAADPVVENEEVKDSVAPKRASRKSKKVSEE